MLQRAILIAGPTASGKSALALKLARAHTGRPMIISAQGGYHGHTGLALAAGDDQRQQQHERPHHPVHEDFKRGNVPDELEIHGAQAPGQIGTHRKHDPAKRIRVTAG